MANVLDTSVIDHEDNMYVKMSCEVLYVQIMHYNSGYYIDKLV